MEDTKWNVDEVSKARELEKLDVPRFYNEGSWKTWDCKKLQTERESFEGERKKLSVKKLGNLKQSFGVTHPLWVSVYIKTNGVSNGSHRIVKHPNVMIKQPVATKPQKTTPT
jgi:hypothetical protein